jgi:hypothetical protein
VGGARRLALLVRYLLLLRLLLLAHQPLGLLSPLGLLHARIALAHEGDQRPNELVVFLARLRAALRQ